MTTEELVTPVAPPEELAAGPAAAGEDAETQLYDYHARSIRGTTHSGYVDAPSEEAASAVVAAAALEPVQVKRSPSRRRARRRKWGNKEMAEFCEQLVTRVRTGVKPAQGLEQIGKTTTHPKLKAALKAAVSDMRDGQSFSAALRPHKQLFSEGFCTAVEIGHGAGQLVRTLELFRDNCARTANAQSLAKKATRYPAAVGVFAVGAVIALLYTFVPAMEGVLKSLNGTLPLPTRIVLFVGNTLTSWVGPLIFLSAVALYAFVRRQLRGPWKDAWQRKQLDLPHVGPLLRHYYAAQACRYIAMLHAAGYKMGKCMEEAANASTNVVFKEILLHASEAITTEGVLPREALTVFASYFGYNIGAILATAAVDGSYDQQLGAHANEMDATVTEELERITELIPMAAIGFLGSTVGAVIISLYLPLFQVIAQLNNSGH